MKILFVSEDIEVGTRGQRELERLGHETKLLNNYQEAAGHFADNSDQYDILLTHQDEDLEKGTQMLLNARVKKPRIITGMLCTELDEQERKKLEGCRISYFEKPYLFRRVLSVLRTKKPPPKVTPWDVKKKPDDATEEPTIPAETTQKKRGLTAFLFGKK